MQRLPIRGASESCQFSRLCGVSSPQTGPNLAVLLAPIAIATTFALGFHSIFPPACLQPIFSSSSLPATMATYYRPPPVRTSANTSHQPGESSLSQTYQPSPEVEPEQSIYIFPVPSSVPSSPGGSSVFSAPSDLMEELTTSSIGRSRHSSISSQFTDASRSYDGSVTRLTFVDEDEEEIFSPMVDIRLDPEVEVWEWSETEAGDDLPTLDESWAFEADGAMGTHSGRRETLVRHSSTSRTMLRRDSRVMRPRPTHIRSRTQSNTSAHSVTRYTPHPRVRVPLLSFVASLLSLDLDDPALRLLTHSTPDSVLFPGQSALLHDTHGPPQPSHYADTSQEDEEDTRIPLEEDNAHGLLRLLTEGSSSKSVREGLAAICESPLAIANPFALPSWNSLTSLYRLVGEVWTNGGQAWRELGGSPATHNVR